MIGPSPLLVALRDLVEEAGRTAQRIRDGITRELKPDGSIVTAADRLLEEELRRKLPELIPGSTVWGEEYGFEEEGPGGLWIVDPIDGTSNYAFGSPMWGVSAALLVGEEMRLGAVFLPDLDEMYLAERGAGAYCNGERMRPKTPGPIHEEELVSYCDYLLRDYPSFRFPGRMRCSGSFVIDGCFVAQNRFRGLIGIRERLYDIAGCCVLNLELGAEIRYADGDSLSFADLKNGRLSRPWIIFPKGSDFFLRETPVR